MMSKLGGGLALSSAGNALSVDDIGDSDLDGKVTTGGRLESSRPLKKNRSKSKSNSNNSLTRKAIASRPALKEIANTLGASDTEGIDDLEKPGEQFGNTQRQKAAPEVTVKPQAKRGKTAKTKGTDAKQSSKQSSVASPTQQIEETNDTQDTVLQSKLNRSQKAANKRLKPNGSDGADVQLEAMDIDSSEIQDIVSPEDPVPQLPTKSTRRAGPSARNRQSPVSRSRAGSLSDTERGSDAVTRRKLNEMSKKFEALEVKYRDLKEIGAEGDLNFDVLKKQSDEKTKAANELIESLRAELSIQKALISESSKLQAELEANMEQSSALMAEKKLLESSLQEAQNEIKTMSAKLSATRSASASCDSISIVPGSAVKSQPRTLVAGSAEATKELQKRQLKEDLYSDLTGLILRDVKRRDEQGEDVYDCIQTGRNGTLHFHLSISTSVPTSYEDAEFQYTPLLDASRDRDLLEILPDYLTEEICFPRSNAAKFYARVVDCMTKKIEFVEE